MHLRRRELRLSKELILPIEASMPLQEMGSMNAQVSDVRKWERVMTAELQAAGLYSPICHDCILLVTSFVK